MFGNPDGTGLSSLIGMGMFDSCNGADFHLGEKFGLAPEWATVPTALTGFFLGAFTGSSLETLPDNFTFEHITNLGMGGFMWTFKNCDGLVNIPDSFRLPYLGDGDAVDEPGVFVETFATDNNDPLPKAGDALAILNGNQPPNDQKGTFRTGDGENATLGQQRWDNFTEIDPKWKGESASTTSSGMMNFWGNLKKALSKGQ